MLRQGSLLVASALVRMDSVIGFCRIWVVFCSGSVSIKISMVPERDITRAHRTTQVWVLFAISAAILWDWWVVFAMSAAIL